MLSNRKKIKDDKKNSNSYKHVVKLSLEKEIQQRTPKLKLLIGFRIHEALPER